MSFVASTFIAQHRSLSRNLNQLRRALAAKQAEVAREALARLALDGCAHLHHEYLAATDLVLRVRDPGATRMVTSYAERASGLYGALAALAQAWSEPGLMEADFSTITLDVETLGVGLAALAADEETMLFPAINAWAPLAVSEDEPTQPISRAELVAAGILAG